MNQNDVNKSSLPMRALQEIPTPKSSAKTITGLVKDSGRVVGYQLSDQNTVTKEQGVNLAKQGEIQGVGIGIRKGNEYLKSLPDGDENSNLSNLPSVPNK